MKYSYTFRTIQAKYAYNIFCMLVENFSNTFFVGGTVRDMLLGKKVLDFDIATQAHPHDTEKILRHHHISYTNAHTKFGIIVTDPNTHAIEIATFRTELYTGSRYPTVSFVTSPKTDSVRRDFTMNSLYFSPKTGEILDFYNGIGDIKNKRIKFIGDPSKRIHEDPLRIIRAYRFQLQLGFTLSSDTKYALQKHLSLLQTLTKSRIDAEVEKLRSKILQKKLRTIINKNT